MTSTLLHAESIEAGACEACKILPFYWPGRFSQVRARRWVKHRMGMQAAMGCSARCEPRWLTQHLVKASTSCKLQMPSKSF